MTQGYCEACRRLVPIGPRGPRVVARGETRQADWYPLPHSVADTGGPLCRGTAEAIQDHEPDHPVMAPVHSFD